MWQITPLSLGEILPPLLWLVALHVGHLLEIEANSNGQVPNTAIVNGFMYHASVQQPVEYVCVQFLDITVSNLNTHELKFKCVPPPVFC